MRTILPALCLLLSQTAQAAPPNKAAPDMAGKTWLSVEGPTGKPAKPGTPVLQFITATYNTVSNSGAYFDIVPHFRFHAPGGNAVMLRRELVETDSAITQEGIRSAPIQIPTAQQIAGAIIDGGWVCGPGRYHVTLRAFLLDTQGNRGNAMQYTLHCNELLMY
jgi:hypothetical protein